MSMGDGDRGRRIAGKYELIEIGGEGGMAVVWRAQVIGSTRQVAVKRLKPAWRAHPVHLEMFEEEARVGFELVDSHVVETLDFVKDVDGSPCLVSEWIDGMDLGRLLKVYRARHERAPWALAVLVGLGSARGLAAAHERRTMEGTPSPIVHRDVSPHNILVGVDGAVKLSDFGLARARDRVKSLTAPGIVKGKLSYLAPEITRGGSATPLSDQFALGSVLWEALAGRALFDGQADRDVFRKIYRGEIDAIGDVRAGLPDQLVHAVHRALDVDPAARFPSAGAFADELEQIVAQTLGEDDHAHARLGQAVADAQASAPRRPVGEGSATAEMASRSDPV